MMEAGVKQGASEATTRRVGGVARCRVVARAATQEVYALYTILGRLIQHRPLNAPKVLSVNLSKMEDFPTPASPISKSLNKWS